MKIVRIGATRRAPRTRSTGFNLVELLLTLALAAILLSLGVPAWRDFTGSSATRSAATGLLGSLQLARSEAVSRGERVTVCVPNSERNGCSGSSDWTQGWVVFVDSELVQVGPEISSDVSSLRAVDLNAESTTALTEVVLAASGRQITGGADTPISIAFLLCDHRASRQFARAVVITPAGGVSAPAARELPTNLTCPGESA